MIRWWLRHPLLVALLALALLLSGCATPGPQIVRVPVAAECPAPAVVPRPALAVADLTPDAAPDAVLKAYAATVEALMSYAEALETQLDAYRSKQHEQRQ